MCMHLAAKLQSTLNPREIVTELKEDIRKYKIINSPHSTLIINENLQYQRVSMPNLTKHLKEKKTASHKLPKK